MSELVFEVLIIFFEVFLCKMFCEIFGETRYRGWLAGMQFIMAGSCIFAAARIPGGFLIAEGAAAVCVLAAYIFCHVKIRIGRAFLLVLLYQAMSLFIEFMVSFFNNAQGAAVMADGGPYGFENIPAMLIGKAVMFLFILAVRKCLRGDFAKLLLGDGVFGIQDKNWEEMYRSVSEDFEQQKRRTHEYKNQIICMQALMEEKQYEKLEEYINGMFGRADRKEGVVDTNNIIVNAVLNQKYHAADAEGIAFVLRVNDLSGLGLEERDVVTVLSNLLDNAIEACRECDGRKVIKLKFVIEDKLVKIGVRNTFQKPLVYENGEIKSTKRFRREEHGAGIRNIAEVVEKYKGFYSIKDGNGEFYFSIVIPA